MKEAYCFLNPELPSPFNDEDYGKRFLDRWHEKYADAKTNVYFCLETFTARLQKGVRYHSLVADLLTGRLVLMETSFEGPVIVQRPIGYVDCTCRRAE